jgi:hypothetical protein
MRRGRGGLVALAASLAFGALGALAACGDADGSGDPVEPQPAADADLEFCVAETNRYRAMAGRPPLARSAALEEYAATGAALDTQQRRAHGHFSDTGGGGIAVVENACPSWLGWSLGPGENAVQDAIAACLEAFHDEGPGTGDAHAHYPNLMGEPGRLGCGLYVDASMGITILQDFGR